MPAYKKMPQVISATCKTFMDGYKTNELAKRFIIKEEIKKALLEKNLTPAEFDAQLTQLVEDRLYSNSRITKIDAPFTHAIDYTAAVYHDINARTAAYKETCFSLRLTPEIKKEIERKILSAEVDTSDNTQLHSIYDLEKVAGFLSGKIRKNKMSLHAAIKIYYLKMNEEVLELEYFQSQISKLSAEKQKEIFLSPHLEEDVFALRGFFEEEIESQYIDKFKNEIRQEIQLGIASPIPATLKDPTYLFYKDDCFPLYCANWIKGTNYIAMSGAKDTVGTAVLMQSLLFSDAMKVKPQVTTIISLGSCIGPGRPDFFNYCFDDSNSTDGKTFTVESAEDVEDDAPMFEFTVTLKNRYVSPQYNSKNRYDFPAGFVSSELDVSGKKVAVLLIGIPDMESLDLGADSAETEKLKELLWQISQKPANEATAVHCAAGVGRTGHIILTLEILKNYQRIFASDNPEVIAQELEAIVNRIRENRKPLVYNLGQYIAAIENADILYQYALEKKYVTEPATLGRMSFLAPTSCPQAEKKEDGSENLFQPH